MPAPPYFTLFPSVTTSIPSSRASRSPLVSNFQERSFPLLRSICSLQTGTRQVVLTYIVSYLSAYLKKNAVDYVGNRRARDDHRKPACYHPSSSNSMGHLATYDNDHPGPGDLRGIRECIYGAFLRNHRCVDMPMERLYGGGEKEGDTDTCICSYIHTYLHLHLHLSISLSLSLLANVRCNVNPIVTCETETWRAESPGRWLRAPQLCIHNTIHRKTRGAWRRRKKRKEGQQVIWSLV